jgi:mannose-6-phosphate isomerase-like protein (cupin superfamily)
MEATLPTSQIVVPSQLSWEPHSAIPGGRIAYLLAPEPGGSSVTCALVELPAGAAPEAHVHGHCDDLLYVLSGKGAVWVEDVGDVALEPGCFLRIRQGVRHRPHDIAETLLIYNTWSPALG